MARDDRDDEHEGTASPAAKPPPEPQHSVHSEPEEPADDEHEGTASPAAKPPPEPQHSVHSEPEEPGDGEDGSPEPERRD